MSKLTLEIPLKHWDAFTEFCDFHYALAHEVLRSKYYADKYRELSEAGMEVWLDNSYNELKEALKYYKMLKAAELVRPTHIFTLEAGTADRNLDLALHSAACLRKDLPGVKLVTCWRGNCGHLHAMEEFSDIVALPYDEPRWNLVHNASVHSKKYHYLGFNSMFEIREAPPLSLDTSYPIRAAVAGLELTDESERIPGGLGYFDRKAKLSRETLTLAKHNCKVLYEILHKTS